MPASRKTKRGFTLIELTFAIAFISVLVITVALTTNEIISIYRKGHGMKTVDQVGRELIEDITESIRSASSPALADFCERYSGTNKENCLKNNGLFSIYQQYYVNGVEIKYDTEINGRTVPGGGILCTGKYTYIWNTGYVFGSEYSIGGEPVSNSFELFVEYNGDKTKRDFRLLKIEDPTRSICAATVENAYPDPNSTLNPPEYQSRTFGDRVKGFVIGYDLPNEPVEMLDKTDVDLALYDFIVFPPAIASSSNRMFFSGSFILGTIDGSINIMSSSDYCQTPMTYDISFSYCAINKFNFGTQSSGL